MLNIDSHRKAGMESSCPSPASLLGILASLLGILASLLSILQVVLPPELGFAPLKFLNRALNCFSSHCYFDITEIDGTNTNELYNAVQLYLSSFVPASGSRLSLTRAVNSSATTFGLSNNDCISDLFDGVAVLWEHVVTQRRSQTFSWRPLPDEKRCFTLRIRKRDKDLILYSYLDHIMDKANDIRRRIQERLLYTISHGASLDSPWKSVPFKNPSTFDTLAMDPDVKRDIVEDLRRFMTVEALYRQMGRAWKRSYLVCGPPRAGQSMIAAMAKFLSYDIYDLDPIGMHFNSELLNLLGMTSPKSIIVIKDSDCLVNPSNRSKVTQATAPPSHYDAVRGSEGGSNNTITFPDGLSLCCGIFVFTTNHIEKLDPALLQSIRMDVQICISYY